MGFPKVLCSISDCSWPTILLLFHEYAAAEPKASLQTTFNSSVNLLIILYFTISVFFTSKKASRRNPPSFWTQTRSLRTELWPLGLTPFPKMEKPLLMDCLGVDPIG